MPELALAPVAARVAAAGGAAAKGAGTAALLLVLGLSLLGTNRALAANDAETISKEMAWFGANLRCMCAMGGRGCGHMLEDCGAECGGAPVFRQEIRALLEQGKTRDEIIAVFAERFGGMHVLGAPPDSGFNRLAWALPYGLGLAGAGVMAFSAWRFSKTEQGRGQRPGRPGQGHHPGPGPRRQARGRAFTRRHVSAPTDVASSSAADTPKRGFSIPGWAICATGVVLALLYGVLVARPARRRRPGDDRAGRAGRRAVRAGAVPRGRSRCCGRRRPPPGPRPTGSRSACVSWNGRRVWC